MRSFGSFVSVTTTIALMAVMANTASAQSCTVCGNAANNFTKPNAKYNKITCQQLQTDLESLADDTACSAVLTGDTYNWFEHESFCGCEGVTAPETCNICADDEMIAFPTNPALTIGEERFSCEETVELARHVSDSTVCTNVVATPAVKQACCRKIGSVCPLCEAGGSFKPENRYQNITCEAIQQDTVNLDSVQCKSYYGRDTHYWMNWETFCGCENAVVSDKPCTLCGSNLELINPEAIAPWTNETDTFTCQQANDLAIHVDDNDVCVDEVQTPEVLAACCGPITGGGGGGATSAAVTPSVVGVVSAAATGFLMAVFMLAM